MERDSKKDNKSAKISASTRGGRARGGGVRGRGRAGTNEIRKSPVKSNKSKDQSKLNISSQKEDADKDNFEPESAEYTNKGPTINDMTKDEMDNYIAKNAPKANEYDKIETKDHVLMAPGMYIGSIEHEPRQTLYYDVEDDRIHKIFLAEFSNKYLLMQIK